MGLSRKDLLKRIRYGKRVNYDAPPPERGEMVEPPVRPTRMFRPVNAPRPVSSKGKTLGEFAAAQAARQPVPRPPVPGQLTPTQHALINEIPQKYGQPNHAIRSFIVNHVSSRYPEALVHHLSKQFNYPAPEGMSFDTSKMGAQQAQEHSRKLYNYISGLQHHLHRQGDKNYDHNIIKAMGDYLDKNQMSGKVLNQMHQHFSKPQV